MLELSLFNLTNFTPDFAHLVLVFMVLAFFVHYKFNTKKSTVNVGNGENINTEILRRIEGRINQEQKNLSFHERSCQEKYIELVSSLSVVQTTVNNLESCMKDLREEIKAVEGRLLILVDRFNEFSDKVRKTS